MAHLGRRIEKAVQNSADLDCTYGFFYNGQQLVETRDGSDLVLKQYVWGLQYIDELVQVGVNDDPADGAEDDVESFYYAIHNANYNVQLMVDAAGAIAERYEYDPYGQRHVFFSPGTNDPQAYASTYISRRRTVGGIPQPYGLCEFGHQGLFHDEELGLIYNRARMLPPKFGRFMQRDPIEYVDGMSVYQYQQSAPLFYVDPFGLAKKDVLEKIGYSTEPMVDRWGWSDWSWQFLTADAFHNKLWYQRNSLTIQVFGLGGHKVAELVNNSFDAHDLSKGVVQGKRHIPPGGVRDRHLGAATSTETVINAVKQTVLLNDHACKFTVKSKSSSLIVDGILVDMNNGVTEKFDPAKHLDHGALSMITVGGYLKVWDKTGKLLIEKPLSSSGAIKNVRISGATHAGWSYILEASGEVDWKKHKITTTFNGAKWSGLGGVTLFPEGRTTLDQNSETKTFDF